MHDLLSLTSLQLEQLIIDKTLNLFNETPFCTEEVEFSLLTGNSTIGTLN